MNPRWGPQCLGQAETLALQNWSHTQRCCDLFDAKASIEGLGEHSSSNTLWATSGLMLYSPMPGPLAHSP